MANSNVWIVQGFQVKTITVGKEDIKLVLTVNKNDLTNQEGNVADILASLEVHSSGEVPVELTLARCDTLTK